MADTKTSENSEKISMADSESVVSAFLQNVFGEQEGNVTIALRDKPGPDGKVNVYQWFKWPLESAQMVAYAEKFADRDVYYSPLVYGDKKNAAGKIARTPENSISTQVIYADSDTADPGDYRLQPSIVVETSTGRWHNYWGLIEPVSSAEASEIAHRVTTAHAKEGSDQNGWSANKVLRVPGTHNTSHGFPESVRVTYTGNIYDPLDVSGAYDDIDVVSRPHMRPEAPMIPLESPENLPDYGLSLDKVGTRTLELALAEPRDDQDRSRLRYRLLCELVRDGLSFEEMVSVAWHAPASRKWSLEDPRGIAGLVAEAGKAVMEVAYETGEGITPPMPDEEDDVVDARVSILLPHERDSIAHEMSFVNRYSDHAGTRVAKQNRPYDDINGWTILSAATCEVGFIPRRNGPEALNIYSMTLGETTSGKSAARKLMVSQMKEVFIGDPEYNIGGNPSPSALGKKLLERDKKVSFFNKDEAHGAVKTWINQDWQSGLLEALADLYDGKVDPQLRTKDWEASGKSAETFFIMHLMGTPKAMIGILNRDLFLSGFLARFLWAIGDPREITYDSMAEEDSDGQDVKLGFDPMSRQVAVDLMLSGRAIRETMRSTRVPIGIERDAARRLQDAKWQLTKTFEKDRNFEILEPSLVRMGVTIRKAASMLAVSEGRTKATLRDVLMALEAAETWVANLVTVASQISASDWERACDEIVAFVDSRGGEVKREVVMRKFKSVELRFLLSYLDALYGQGRLREFNGEHKAKMIATPKREDR